MTWIGLQGGVYIKPLSGTEVYVISPDYVEYKLVKHSTESIDAETLGRFSDPHSAMVAALALESSRANR